MESKASGEFRKLRMELHNDKLVKQQTLPPCEQTYKLHDMMQFGKCLDVKRYQ